MPVEKNDPIDKHVFVALKETHDHNHGGRIGRIFAYWMIGLGELDWANFGLGELN
jgi:hypothetical protein